MRRIRRHLTFANVASAIALFVALGGGTAIALEGVNSVQSDDLGPGAQVKAPDVAANAVDISDLNATSRPHKLEFSAGDTGPVVIATVGHLRLRGECQEPAGVPTLFIRLRNLDAQQGTLNGMFSSQTTGNGAVSWRGVGEFVNPGSSTHFQNNDVVPDALARGSFNRVEGQVVFRTPGRVTTIDFHAFSGNPGNPPQCEFYGTAVTSSLN